LVTDYNISELLQPRSNYSTPELGQYGWIKCDGCEGMEEATPDRIGSGWVVCAQPTPCRESQKQGWQSAPELRLMAHGA
jgi:hypothetical protein